MSVKMELLGIGLVVAGAVLVAAAVAGVAMAGHDAVRLPEIGGGATMGQEGPLGEDGDSVRDEELGSVAAVMLVPLVLVALSRWRGARGPAQAASALLALAVVGCTDYGLAEDAGDSLPSQDDDAFGDDDTSGNGEGDDDFEPVGDDDFEPVGDDDDIDTTEPADTNEAILGSATVDGVQGIPSKPVIAAHSQ